MGDEAKAPTATKNSTLDHAFAAEVSAGRQTPFPRCRRLVPTPPLLPSATWTPPSLRHFGFPAEFREFLEVNAIRLLTPWAEKVWNLLKDDYHQIPHNWKNIPNGRRTIYVITGFVSCYYFVVSLYAIPLVALGFLTPAYLCRQYLENDGIDEDTEHNTDNNNNDDVKNIIVSVREMSLWMKFWVSFCGWLLASSIAPGILTA